MNRTLRDSVDFRFTQISLFALLLWAGMVAGISFLEAPLKFTAPQVTLAIGLGIGRLVFSWLNKCELVLGILVVIGLYFNRPPFRIWLPVFLLWTVLMLQTTWLLPALDARALQIMAGKIPQPGYWHLVYVTLEIFKLGLLLGTASSVYRYQFVPVPSRRQTVAN